MDGKLKETCDEANIDFFTSPYSLELVDYVDNYVPAYKIYIITWIEIIKKIASKNKPYILATGASNFDEVKNSVNEAISINPNMAILQCNTNYTGDLINFIIFKFKLINTIETNILNLVLGLMNIKPGHTTVLGAITISNQIIEKHFTDNNSRIWTRSFIFNEIPNMERNDKFLQRTRKCIR